MLSMASVDVISSIQAVIGYIFCKKMRKMVSFVNTPTGAALTYTVFSFLNYLYFLALLSRCCSDLFGIFFTKLFILFSSPFPGAAFTYSVFSLLIIYTFLALLSRCCSEPFGIFLTKLFICLALPFQVML